MEKNAQSQDAVWMWLNAAAIAASLSHVLIDYTLGLYGKISTLLSPLQATTILLISLLYAYWMLVINWASNGKKSALLSLLLLTIMWPLLANGVAGMVACPPLCNSDFPYQDISHAASLISGGLATYMTWRKFRVAAGVSDWWLPAYTGILLITTFVFQSVLSSLNI